ncbi:hypothetical protein [Nocardia inohanensis]|uniref:hypothetical protein n=1 Tax=Nocardia inohanensis TaxID=209246 RepID=UPI000831FF10|nr:hypothetical protein [Nocardia inohanensis]
MPEFIALTPQALADRIARRAFVAPGPRVVAVDGADAAEPVALARMIAERGVEYGWTAGVVDLHDFVRPASLRYEFGRDDEMSYRSAWFDYGAVDREVVRAIRERGRWLPALWDERADRSARAKVRQMPAHTVLFVAGPMLSGRGLKFDLTVALRMSAAALRRKTPEQEWFTLAALREHEAGAAEESDFVVAWDHPDRPALRVEPGDH